MERRDNDDTTNRLRNMVPIIAGVTIIAVTIFGSADDPWRQFIHEWQTLITGFAAIAAALITVREMQRVDIRSADRHLDLMAIQFRGDLSKAHKFLENEGRQLLREMHQIRLYVGKANEALQQRRVPQHVSAIAAAIENVQAILASETQYELLPVATSQWRMDRNEILGLIASYGRRLNTIRHASSMYDREPDDPFKIALPDHLAGEWEAVLQRAVVVCQALDTLLDDLADRTDKLSIMVDR